MTTKTTKTKIDSGIDAEEVIRQVPIGKIFVDKSWNCRKYLGEDSEGGPEEHSFSDLVTTIASDGQDTPINVRTFKSSDHHYSLVAGFRRYSAISKIYAQDGKVPGIKKGTIKVIVKEMTDLEAMVQNGRENTSRANLNMADTAFLVHRLAKVGKLKDIEIAQKLGLSIAYVNSLHTVYKNTVELRIQHKDGSEQTIFDHWRDAPGRVSFQNLLALSRTKLDGRIKELKYMEMLNVQPSDEVAKKNNSTNIKKNDVSIADTFGALMGRLAAADLVDIPKFDWKRILEIGKRMKFDGQEKEYIEKVLKAASDGYVRGFNARSSDHHY